MQKKKKQTNLTNKQISLLLIIMIICTYLTWFLVVNITYKNEHDLYDKYKDNLAVLQYMNSNPKFDYFNGLWLMPTGLIMVFALIILMDKPKMEEK